MGCPFAKTTGPNSGESVMVAQTNDGGSSWTVVPVKPISSEPLKRYARSASIFFLDGTRGWLTMRLTSGSNFSFGLLFATNDGGNTWLQLPDPRLPILFTSPAQCVVGFRRTRSGQIMDELRRRQIVAGREGQATRCGSDLHANICPSEVSIVRKGRVAAGLPRG